MNIEEYIKKCIKDNDSYSNEYKWHQEKALKKLWMSVSSSDSCTNEYIRLSILNHAYNLGVLDGKYELRDTDLNISEEPKNTCDIDICISYRFGDNDFGGCVKQGCEGFIGNISRLLDHARFNSEHKVIKQCDLDRIDLNKYMSIDKLKECLYTGFIGSYLLCQSEYNNLDNPIEHAIETAEYIGIKDDKNYIIGTKDDVHKQVLKECTFDEDSDPYEGRTPHIFNIWDNGERLILYIDKDWKIKSKII